MKEFSLTTFTIVDGTSIEEAMATGDQPILLAGRIVPQGTYDFIKDAGEIQTKNLPDKRMIGAVASLKDKKLVEICKI